MDENKELMEAEETQEAEEGVENDMVTIEDFYPEETNNNKVKATGLAVLAVGAITAAVLLIRKLRHKDDVVEDESEEENEETTEEEETNDLATDVEVEVSVE